MRLALLGALCAAALPLAAAGQGQTAPLGSVIAVGRDAFVINFDECSSTTANIELAWWVSPQITTSGVYRLYASNREPATREGGTVKFCATEPGTVGGTEVKAGQVGDELDDAQANDTSRTDAFPVKAFVDVTGRNCAQNVPDQEIHVCMHFIPFVSGTTTPDPNGPTASAIGVMKLMTQRPATPTGLSLRVGDRRLYASWTAGSGGATAASRYQLVATPPAASGLPTRTETTSGSGTTGSVGGLTNDTEYSVVVYALSSSGTRSEASAPALGTPHPVKDFWDVYREQGGTEEGGCGGPAGPLALLGLAGLVVARRARRNP